MYLADGDVGRNATGKTMEKHQTLYSGYSRLPCTNIETARGGYI